MIDMNMAVDMPWWGNLVVLGFIVALAYFAYWLSRHM